MAADEPQHKKACTGALAGFDSFKLTRVLREDPQARLLALLGSFEGSEEQAVMVVNQKAFAEDTVEAMLTSSTAKSDLHNDIYMTYDLMLKPEFCQASCQVTYPATDKHIQKWAAQTFCMVRLALCRASATGPSAVYTAATRAEWI